MFKLSYIVPYMNIRLFNVIKSNSVFLGIERSCSRKRIEMFLVVEKKKRKEKDNRKRGKHRRGNE